jgi:hypothetical protein
MSQRQETETERQRQRDRERQEKASHLDDGGGSVAPDKVPPAAYAEVGALLVVQRHDPPDENLLLSPPLPLARRVVAVRHAPEVGLDDCRLAGQKHRVLPHLCLGGRGQPLGWFTVCAALGLTGHEVGVWFDRPRLPI